MLTVNTESLTAMFTFIFFHRSTGYIGLGASRHQSRWFDEAQRGPTWQLAKTELIALKLLNCVDTLFWDHTHSIEALAAACAGSRHGSKGGCCSRPTGQTDRRMVGRSTDA